MVLDSPPHRILPGLVLNLWDLRKPVVDLFSENGMNAVYYPKYKKEKGKDNLSPILSLQLHSFSMDLRVSRVRERRSLSEGRVAQKDLVIAFASGSPGSVAQKAFDTSETSFSDGRVAQNALVKLSSIFSLSGFNGFIPVLSPPHFLFIVAFYSYCRIHMIHTKK
jgi:hypothetical protein